MNDSGFSTSSVISCSRALIFLMGGTSLLVGVVDREVTRTKEQQQWRSQLLIALEWIAEIN